MKIKFKLKHLRFSQYFHKNYIIYPYSVPGKLTSDYYHHCSNEKINAEERKSNLVVVELKPK